MIIVVEEVTFSHPEHSTLSDPIKRDKWVDTDSLPCPALHLIDYWCLNRRHPYPRGLMTGTPVESLRA